VQRRLGHRRADGRIVQNAADVAKPAAQQAALPSGPTAAPPGVEGIQTEGPGNGGRQPPGDPPPGREPAQREQDEENIGAVVQEASDNAGATQAAGQPAVQHVTADDDGEQQRRAPACCRGADRRPVAAEHEGRRSHDTGQRDQIGPGEQAEHRRPRGARQFRDAAHVWYNPRHFPTASAMQNTLITSGLPPGEKR